MTMAQEDQKESGNVAESESVTSSESAEEDSQQEATEHETEEETEPLLYSRMSYSPIKDRADILIVTNAELAEAWIPFAKWKTSTGRPAKIVTTQFITEEFSGDDIQQKIRACCLKHIDEQQTKWVVLGGDSSEDAGIVPDRDTDHSDCKMLPYDNIPTDLYYISEKDWDANDDGKYGVFADDMEEVAYFNPTASIGRIPIRTADDVAAYTEKVIAYESRYPVGDFARRMVYTCPENSAYPKLETSMAEVSDAWKPGYVSRFFGNRTAWDDTKRGEHDLTLDNWVKMVNNRQASKIHMHGHGLLNLWMLEKYKKLKTTHVDDLENENAYPIITTVSCLTGQYDDKQDPCISESMLRQPRAGAIAMLAPSREGVPFMKSESDFRLMMTEGKMDGTTIAYTKFWKIALSEDLTLGEAFRKVKMEMDEDARENDGFHMAQCELNLLGDPSLCVRAAAPDSLQVQTRLSGNKLKLRSIPNATVCIWGGNDQYIQKEASSRGRLTVELESADDELHVTVTTPGHNIWSRIFSASELAASVNKAREEAEAAVAAKKAREAAAKEAAAKEAAAKEAEAKSDSDDEKSDTSSEEMEKGKVHTVQ